MQCKARAATGKQCKAAALAGGELCFMHSPKVASKRAEARLKGGRNRKRGSEPKGVAVVIARPGDVLALANSVIVQAWGLENGVNRGRLLLAAAELALKVLEVTEAREFAARLAALEGLANASNNR